MLISIFMLNICYYKSKFLSLENLVVKWPMGYDIFVELR